ncbi:MAG: cobalamin biosynthesis protein CobD [Dethiosulfovibrio peptidovorans]|nr:MAG: cobalamin biosynthesis protein CobD [Dethiosulfovibrio peptidovorans]
MMVSVVILALAVVWDLCLGEPPSGVHPVCWMGRWIDCLWSRRPPTGLSLLIYGGGIVLSGGGACWALGNAVSQLPLILFVPLSAWLLKGSASASALWEAGRSVRNALKRDLRRARRELGTHLVSRDTRLLSRSEVAGAAVESLTENLADGWVAPLMAYALFGLSGALVYRFVNTCDSMLGYRYGDFELGGKAAARLDDLLSYLPSRVASALLLLGAASEGLNWRRGLRTVLSQHRRTASPNAGWPMAAMAGALGVTLSKRGVYRLCGGPHQPGIDHLSSTMAVLTRAQGMMVVLAALLVLAS